MLDLVAAAMFVALASPAREAPPPLRVGVVFDGAIETSDPEVRTATLRSGVWGSGAGRVIS